jgi:F0F1-type ATP synthase epsilon subunit
MTKSFKLVVRTPEAEVEDRDVQSIKVTTEGGEMMVLPGHADLSGSILFSRLEVKGEGFEESYMVRRGLIFVDREKNRTTIMAYSCDKVEDVDFTSVEEYLKMVNERLAAGEELSDFQLSYLEGEKLAVTRQLEQR